MTGDRRVVTVVVSALLACFAGGACGDNHDARPDGSPYGMGGRPVSHDAGAGTGGSSGTAGSTGGAAGHTSPPALPPPSAHLTPGSVCEADGWCWYNPLPSGTWWRTVAGAGRTDLWIGGHSSTVLHFDGGRWSSVLSPLSFVPAVWAASENDVWFGGMTGDMTPGQDFAAALAHWDGVSMTLIAEFPDDIINDVWGSGPNDVYAAGTRDTTWHWDGNAWTALADVPGGTLVTGTGPNDVWLAATTGDRLRHFDGTTWSAVPELAPAGIGSLVAIAPNDVWAIVHADFNRTLVRHFDGVAWRTDFEATDPTETLDALGASATNDVWLVGSVAAPGEERGYVNHYDGQTWRRAPAAPSPLENVRHAPGVGTVAVGRDGSILQLTATPVPAFTDLRTGSMATLAGVFGSAPDDMWAVGSAGTVLHFDGRAVSALAVPTTANLLDVWGTGPDDVWIVGMGGTVLHWNGQSFTPLPSGTTVDLKAVFTARADDVWIGGDGGTLLHWNGGAMSAVAVAGVDPMTAILDIHGLGASDVWFAGGGNVATGPFTTTPVSFVSHFDGTSWSPAEQLEFLFGEGFVPERIWELAPDDVWIANDFSHAYGINGYWHFDGVAWTGEELHEDDPRIFMFPNQNRASFVFGPHDRWIVNAHGSWLRNTR